MRIAMRGLCAMILLAGGLLSLPARTLEVERGSLSRQLNLLQTGSDTDLRLTGEADTDDLSALSSLPSRIELLDLSELKVPAIPPYALYGTGVRTVRLPADISRIGAGAFSHTPLERIDLPASVGEVGDYAFAGCQRLESATLPLNARLGEGIFSCCSSLNEVSLGDNIAAIPARTFDGCSSLEYSIPASVSKIGARAFRGAGIESADLRNVASIGEYAFADTPFLQEIDINRHQEVEMGQGVFSGMLMNLILTDFPHTMPSHTFANSPRVRFKSWISAAEVGEAALAGNLATDAIALTGAVKRIGAHAFRNVRGLKAVDVSNMTVIPDTDPLAFSGLEDQKGNYPVLLIVNKSMRDQWKAHPLWGLFRMEETTGSGADDILAEDAGIRISREGGRVEVTATHPIESVEIYTSSGLLLHSDTPLTEHWTHTGLPQDEILLIRVLSSGSARLAKLL